LIILIRNNFYASYFCRCAFNTKKTTGKWINLFLAKTDPKPQEMIELMGKCISQSFYQRN
jgi:hypothetical protein